MVLRLLRLTAATVIVAVVLAFPSLAADRPPRCEVVPLPGHEVSFRVDGVEKTRWCYGNEYPRPFFFPFNGPAGATLTRMGHPGAPDHDHHRGVWFAHNKVAGNDFWSDGTRTQVRQKAWLAYEDGDDEAIMASDCGWFDGDGSELLDQQVVAALIPMENGEHGLEFQVTFQPGAGRDKTVLEQTNFGFLAVRIAKSISEHFGGGTLTNSSGQQGETNIFGKPAKWMDYSGQVSVGKGPSRRVVVEGITFFDHPHNPRYPTHWHVREDGWMGASCCFQDGHIVTKDQPLVLRYFLYAHRNGYDGAKAASVHKTFAKRAGFAVSKSKRPHLHYEVKRRAD